MTTTKKLNQAGDTILEVLIAIAVVGLVLGLSYTSVNRSLKATRASQERGEAIKIAESQLEKLNLLSVVPVGVSDPSSIFNPTNRNFCLYSAVPTDLPTRVNFSSYNPDVLLENTNYSQYPPQCIDGRYYFSITYQDKGGATRNIFKVIVRWERVSGGYDQLITYYRLHNP